MAPPIGSTRNMSLRAIPRTLSASRVAARHRNAVQRGTISVAPPVRSPATRSFTEATPPCIQKELCSCSSRPSIVASATLIGISLSIFGYSSLASGQEDNRDSRKAALCESEGERSACTDKETFVSAVADSIPEQNRHLDRKRFGLDLNAWNTIISVTERALTVGSADVEDEESDCSTSDELPADLPPIPHIVEAKATAPLIDPETGMSLEILFVRDQHNRLIGTKLLGHADDSGECTFNIAPGETAFVRIAAIYRHPHGRGPVRLYYSALMPILDLPRKIGEDDDDGYDDDD